MLFSETTPYQRIVVTRGRAGVRLFLNGNLQFAFSATSTATTRRSCIRRWRRTARRKRVLVLGGGDGMAVREVLQVPAGRAASRWSSSTRT